MVSKLPAWVGAAAFFLACAAGCLNAFTMIGPVGQPVTHVTGTTTNLALAVAHGDVAGTVHFFLLLFFFFAGAAVSGFVVRDSNLRLGRRYGISLCTEAVLLLVTWIIFDTHPLVGQVLVSFSCGLQNAMATTYSGAVVRTTHVTGLFTDLGLQLGNRWAGMQVMRKKIKLQALLVAGYFSGCLLSALLYQLTGKAILFFPISVAVILALIYFIYWIRMYGIGSFLKKSVTV